MSELLTRTLPARSSYWCVVERRFSSTSFNPNTAGDPEIGTVGGRFHPFESPVGTRVPTKYLADHENGAFAETLMRGSPDPSVLDIEQIEARRLAHVSLERPIHLADLTAPDSSSPLTEWLLADHRGYVPLRKVAATLHAQRSNLDGLLWEGRQLDQAGMKVLVLFGDRVSSETDLVEIESYEIDRGTGLRMLRAAARLRRYRLPSVLDTRA